MLFKRHALHYWRLPECEQRGWSWEERLQLAGQLSRA